jgi:hypothetical protein
MPNAQYHNCHNVFVEGPTNIQVTGSANLAILIPKQPGNKDADSDLFPFQLLGLLLEDSSRCSCQQSMLVS